GVHAERRNAVRAARAAVTDFSRLVAGLKACAALRHVLEAGMKRAAIMIVAATLLSIAPAAQQGGATLPRPGDRPAPNIHSTRSVVMGRSGMIATSQPLASVAGLRVMQE